MLAACQSEPGSDVTDESAPRLTAATLGEQTVRANSEYLAEAPLAGADLREGERLAAQCRACHSLEAGRPHMIGPNLHGFFGSAAGRARGYAYSPALKDSEFRWTPRALDAWLAKPREFLPGNRMTYAGLNDPADRQAVIAYLLVATDDTAQ
jgi:cytochrome c